LSSRAETQIIDKIPLPPHPTPYPAAAHAAVMTSLKMELCITRRNDTLRSNQARTKQRQAGIRHHCDQRSELAPHPCIVAPAFGGP
jgi:hypothetical protein